MEFWNDLGRAAFESMTQHDEKARIDKETLKKQQERAKTKEGAHPMDRPPDPADHMAEDEAKGRTLRDLDERPE